MRENLERLLERERDRELKEVFRVIYNVVIAFIQRHAFTYIMYINFTNWYFCRRRYLRIRQNIIFVQKFVRVST